VAATVTPSPAAAASISQASPPPAHAGHTSVAVWAALLLVAAIALVGVWMLIRERRTSTARVEPQTPAAASATLERPSAVPPAPEQAWTAQVEWRGTGRHCTFCVVATTIDAGRTATLPASPLIEWPPADASAVRAMTEAVSTLEVSLLAAGWSPLPPGDAWFAKRFAWRPRAQETSTPQAAARPRRAARTRVRSARLGTGGPDTT
jgi:hypothetical protein